MSEKPDRRKQPRERRKPHPPGADRMVRVSRHARASRSVARAKAWGGILGAAVVGVASWRAGVDPYPLAARTLLGALVGVLAAWAVAVAIWRQLVVAELRIAVERARAVHERTMEQRRAAAEARAAEQPPR